MRSPVTRALLLIMFSGNTERQLLASIEEIVEESLPNKKLADHFQDPEAAKLCILNKIAFCETRQKVPLCPLCSVEIFCTLIL